MGLKERLPDAFHQLKLVDAVERSIASNRLSHGLLLQGQQFADIEVFAKAIAAELLDTSSSPLDHPDCFTLRPKGKARDIVVGDDNSETNTIRKLNFDIAQTSNQGGRKVALIFHAERMNRSAANAFLKTLEEPPRDTFLLLLTSKPYGLLDTIRSRCLNFKLPALSVLQSDPDWEQWRNDFRRWLIQISGKLDRQTLSHAIFAIYGLSIRFQSTLNNQSSNAWKDQKENLSHTASKDEQAALETGISKETRDLFLADIESELSLFCREIESLNTGQIPSLALARAVAALEEMSGLLKINYTLSTALEVFLLKTLRIFSNR